MEAGGGGGAPKTKLWEWGGGGGGNQIELMGNWGAEGGAIKMYFGEYLVKGKSRLNMSSLNP